MDIEMKKSVRNYLNSIYRRK